MKWNELSDDFQGFQKMGDLVKKIVMNIPGGEEKLQQLEYETVSEHLIVGALKIDRGGEPCHVSER